MNFSTIGKSCEGTVVFGRAGSGKTSGTAAHLSRAMLKDGYGGLVLCAQTGEAETWRARAAASGRTNDLVFVTADDKAKLNQRALATQEIYRASYCASIQ